jgi:hypothetical protein
MCKVSLSLGSFVVPGARFISCLLTKLDPAGEAHALVTNEIPAIRFTR